MDGSKGAFLKHWIHYEAHLEAFGSHGSWSGGAWASAIVGEILGFERMTKIKILRLNNQLF